VRARSFGNGFGHFPDTSENFPDTSETFCWHGRAICCNVAGNSTVLPNSLAQETKSLGRHLCHFPALPQIVTQVFWVFLKILEEQ
jgi:hypothetical protein